MKQIVIIFFTIVSLSNCRLLVDTNCGQDAEFGDVPYHASLQYFDTNEHFASAAILNIRWVLSTARGLVGRSADAVNIIFGAIQLDKPSLVQRSSEFRIHPSFDANRRINDIATIRAGFGTTFPPFVSPIVVSPINVGIGSTAQVSGWNPYTTRYPSILQKNDVEIVPCETQILSQTCGKLIGQENSSIKRCGMDSGSPLVSNNMLVGLKLQHFGEYESTYEFLLTLPYRSWIMGNTPL